MRKNLFITLIIGSVILLASCTTQKKLSYVRTIDAQMNDSINSYYIGYEEPTIKVGDELLIYVSAVDPEAAAPYNIPTVSHMSPGSNTVTTTSTVLTYQVDKDGNITFPVLGDINVVGKNKAEVKDLLTDQLSSYIKDPIVTISILNFYVAVLGEVKNPGKYKMIKDRVSIFDALAAAGDMTAYGKRNNVLVSREVNGKMEFARLNMNSPEIYASPYFYLQQNDMVYVEPNTTRAISSQNLSLYLSMLTSLGSMATVVISIVNLNK